MTNLVILSIAWQPHNDDKAPMDSVFSVRCCLLSVFVALISIYNFQVFPDVYFIKHYALRHVTLQALNRITQHSYMKD